MQQISRRPNLYIQLGTFAFIWVLVLLISESSSFPNLILLVNKFPIAVTIYAVVVLLFSKWLWKLEIFKGWLVKIPNIQGTWRGELISTWQDPRTGRVPDTIPILLVIRQDYFNIYCALLTQESISHSITADIIIDRSGLKYLGYSYTNRSRASARDRSEIHDGAATLQIITAPKSLKGEYWTSRKSTGEMALIFETESLAETFFE